MRNSFNLLAGSGIYIRVRTPLTVFIAAFCCLTAAVASAAHTRATLVLSAATAKPGDTVLAALRLQMDPGWHTYWKNPGAAGAATKIEWQLPPGVTAGEIQWPLPEKTPDGELSTYVYQHETALLVPLKLASDLEPGPLELKAKMSWLECDKVCVPGKTNVSATLEIGDATKPSADSELIKQWQSKLPRPADGLSARIWWEKQAEGDSRALILEWNAAAAVKEADFFPGPSDPFEIQPDTEILSAGPDKIRLRKIVKKFEGDWPKEISGVLIQKAGGERQGFDVKLSVADGASVETKPASKAAAAVTTNPGIKSLGKMLLYALIGGLILNIMPCVLPVIALKILGFVSQAKQNPREVRKLGLIYTAGVLVSFLVLAALVIGVKSAGLRAGWGMQFGNPQFIVVLMVLVTLVALNLFGLFEVTLSGRVLDTAGGLTLRHGAAGAFFNGVLATLLATPCTAPFLSVALGFAFAQTAAVIVLIFLAVGAGLALPYLILSWQPAWLKFLPKPGAWMEKFKIAMGFPMLATAVWLFNLTPAFYGKRVWWLGFFLVLVAMAAWIYGEFFQRGRARRGLALALTLVLLVGGYAYAIEGQLRWRSPLPPEETAGSLKESPDGIDWQRWSPEAVAKARAEGRPVFVDFTADWCVTCQFNKRTSIEIASVRAKLREINAVALLGDHTRLPADIADELTRFGRAGVPLVLVYPKNASEPPIVLPEALTPGIVLNALNKAAISP
jgi:thiol:disulfide interchange protein/DsbC/DsbD-like thiol-disulfide interchange protein